MSSAVAVRANDGMQVYPSIPELLNMGKLFISSRLGNENIQRPEEFAVLALSGRELGMGPMESVQTLYTAGQGQVGKFTKVLVAQYHQAGHTYNLRESTADTCTIDFWLKGRREAYTYTLTRGECDDAGWPRNSKGLKYTWKAMPAVMLRYRTLSTGIRACAPDVERMRLDQASLEEIVAHSANSDIDIWDDPAAIGERIVALQARLEELLDQRDGMQDDEAIEGEVTEIETGPHWTESAENRETITAKMADLGLSRPEALGALSKACGAELDRFSLYTGSLDDAIGVLEAYVDEKAAAPAGGQLF